MARYRTHTIEFKRQVVGDHLSGGASLGELARRHDVSRELLRVWVRKHEAGTLGEQALGQADQRAYEGKIASLERKIGQLTMELDLLKKGPSSARRPRSARSSPISGPKAVPSEPAAGS
jgi:transposase